MKEYCASSLSFKEICRCTLSYVTKEVKFKRLRKIKIESFWVIFLIWNISFISTLARSFLIPTKFTIFDEITNSIHSKWLIPKAITKMTCFKVLDNNFWLGTPRCIPPSKTCYSTGHPPPSLYTYLYYLLTKWGWMHHNGCPMSIGVRCKERTFGLKVARGANTWHPKESRQQLSASPYENW